MGIVAERFIELSILQTKRRLTPLEKREMNEALVYLEEREWEKAKLKNLSLMATMTNDSDWQHDICKEIDRLEQGG